jgi:formylglycine-generating enzyme required for sulfatase activity
MMRARRRAPLACVALCFGCGPEAEVRPQWRVSIQTDAPVPQFGDRLLVEVETEPPSECVGCTRQFGVEALDAWPISFGVLPVPNARIRVRARLYRSQTVAFDGGPPKIGLLDRSAYLAPSPDGVSEVDLLLGMSCFGSSPPEGSDLTCHPDTGQLGPTVDLDEAHIDVAPGSWPPAATVPCVGDVPAEMRCIPGGAFLLGDVTSYSIHPVLDPVPERLARVDPFLLDEREMTVATIQSLLDAGELSGLPTAHDPDPVSAAHACTYSTDPAYQDLPINCISFGLAAEACDALKKRLPTEAEWEFAAAGRVNESPFPWGTNTDICAHARVGWGVKSIFTEASEDVSCGGLIGGEAGPSAEGHPLDVSPEGIRNLAGNLAEWVADDYARYTEACWHPEQHLLENPLCLPGPNPTKSHRGASFADVPFLARTTYRLGGQPAPSTYRGVRCAR